MWLMEFDESVGELGNAHRWRTENGHKWQIRYKNASDRNHLTGVFYNAESGPRVETSVILGNVSELWLSVKFEKPAIS